MNEKEPQTKATVVATGPLAQTLLENLLAAAEPEDQAAQGSLARIEALLKELVELSKEQLKEIRKQQTRSKTISG